MREFYSVEKLLAYSEQYHRYMDDILYLHEISYNTARYTGKASGLVIDPKTGNHLVQPVYLDSFSDPMYADFLEYANQNALVSTDDPVVHILKTVQPYFDAVWSNAKNSELRRNDRQFQVGDYLKLIEYDQQFQVYTDRWVLGEVTYILEEPTPNFLQPDIVMMSFEEITNSQEASFERSPDI